jgi:hypothetical protein
MRRITRTFLLSALIFVMALSGIPVQAQSNPPAWSASATYAVGDQAQVAGNVYRCIKASMPNAAPPATNFTNWELSFVRANTTLMIGAGQTFPNLVNAWDYALNCKVADGSYLHFYIVSVQANFQETFSAPLVLDHASGARMAIIGDKAASIMLSFAGNGLVIDTGHSLNTISNLTIECQSSAPPTTGISVDSDATISSVSGVTISGFGTCVSASHNATVTLASNCAITGFHEYGCAATSGGSLSANYVTESGGAAYTTGFFADEGGKLFANHSVSSPSILVGYSATRDAYLEIEYAQAVSDQGAGISGSHGAVIDAAGATVSGYVNYGVTADTGSVIDFLDGTATGLGQGNGGTGCAASDRGFVFTLYATYSENYLDIQAQDGGIIDATGAVFSTSAQGGSSTGSYVFGP